MIPLKQVIKISLENIVENLYSLKIPVELEYPSDESRGDYTTNVAFLLAKQVKKPPMQVAEEIAKELTSEVNFLEKIEAVKPGFINFWLSKEYLIKQMQSLLTPEINSAAAQKRIMVEFTDPNPFKEFHVGHIYTNTIGESLCRILEANGAIVWRADYFGDVGMHVAKAIWGMLHTDIDMLEKKEPVYKENLEELMIFADKVIKFLQNQTLSERIKFLGKSYALGSNMYETSERAKVDMKHINKLIYMAAQIMWQKEKNLDPRVDYKKNEEINQHELEKIYELYVNGRKWSLEYFDNIYKRLGMKFDGYYPESIAGERGYKLVKEHIKDGIFEEHEGAIVFRGEKFNLHTRVFINSLGLPTYEAKELGLAPWKYEDFPYDESIIVTGNEIKEYFKVLIAAMTAINPKLGKKTKHLPHGMVRLPEGKMSSRTGKVILGEWLIDEAVKRARELSKESANTSEQIGIGAVKYAFLKSGIGKDIEFDFETSLSLSGNSGPYVQYAYARTQSILRKALSVRGRGLSSNQPLPNPLLKGEGKLDARRYTLYAFTSEELLLLRLLQQFPEKVELAAEKYAPNIICEYLFKLSQNFNFFYQKYRIINADKEEERKFRLTLTHAVGIILKQGLYLLGIQAPDRM